jgi:hypothetical protein
MKKPNLNGDTRKQLNNSEGTEKKKRAASKEA